MSMEKINVLDEFIKELNFDLDVLERFMPVFNINNKDVIASLEIGMDMIDELKKDINSDDTLKRTVNIDKVLEDYIGDMDKMTTSASSEIRLLKEKIIEYGEKPNETD